jgi:hypothetical protein
MKDKFNGNNEKRRPPPHLTGHEVYEIIKDVHVVLDKQKKTARILVKMTCLRNN